MTRTLDLEMKRALVERVRFYRELGIYDFYRREVPPELMAAAATGSVAAEADSSDTYSSADQDLMTPRKKVVSAADLAAAPRIAYAEQGTSDAAQALRIIREDIGDCKRCRLSEGRTNIVFGVGNPKTDLMFIGEAPGADEDATGEPFVGRAGQLLNNMIKAMGISREQIYIANIIKCRPPGNRPPESDECQTCSPFLMRQIASIKPKVIVALGATAAKTLLAMNSSMMEMRGRWYDFYPTGVQSDDPNWSGVRLAVTYHPAYLLRDPRQKAEAWKDLQMVMTELGLTPPPKKAD